MRRFGPLSGFPFAGSPFGGLSPRNTTGRSVDDFFSDNYRRMVGGQYTASGDELTIPAANIREHDNQEGYVIEVAAPGFQKRDFEITVNDDVLTISATCSGQTYEDDRYSRREHCYRSFERSFYLPEHVREEEIDASYENGMLEVRIPGHSDMDRRREPRRVNIR